MKISNVRTLTLLFLFAAILGAAFGFISHKSKVYASAPQYLTISDSDLTQAGYTGVSALSPENDKYLPPNLYFLVAEGSGDGINNMVMVSQYTNGSTYTDPLFKYGTSSVAVSIDGVTGQEATVDDQRVALNFAKGDYYIVIIGPDSAKVEALAGIIASKI